MAGQIKAHEFENRSPEQPNWISERLKYLEVIIMLSNNQPCRFTLVLESLIKVATLSLEFRSFTRAKGHEDRGRYLLQMTYRA
jgi:hypothetical protein